MISVLPTNAARRRSRRKSIHPLSPTILARCPGITFSLGGPQSPHPWSLCSLATAINEPRILAAHSAFDYLQPNSLRRGDAGSPSLSTDRDQLDYGVHRHTLALHWQPERWSPDSNSFSANTARTPITPCDQQETQSHSSEHGLSMPLLSSSVSILASQSTATATSNIRAARAKNNYNNNTHSTVSLDQQQSDVTALCGHPQSPIKTATFTRPPTRRALSRAHNTSHLTQKKTRKSSSHNQHQGVQCSTKLTDLGAILSAEAILESRYNNNGSSSRQASSARLTGTRTSIVAYNDDGVIPNTEAEHLGRSGMSSKKSVAQFDNWERTVTLPPPRLPSCSATASTAPQPPSTRSHRRAPVDRGGTIKGTFPTAATQTPAGKAASGASRRAAQPCKLAFVSSHGGSHTGSVQQQQHHSGLFAESFTSSPSSCSPSVSSPSSSASPPSTSSSLPTTAKLADGIVSSAEMAPPLTSIASHSRICYSCQNEYLAHLPGPAPPRRGTGGRHVKPVLCPVCADLFERHGLRCTACYFVPAENFVDDGQLKCERCFGGTYTCDRF